MTEIDALLKIASAIQNVANAIAGISLERSKKCLNTRL
jgi:hypothetical protein